MGTSVIFDMDGVIFDTERAILACWLEVSQAYPVDAALVQETFIRCIGTNNKQTLDIYNGAFSEYLDEKQRKAFWDESYGLFRRRFRGKALPVKPGAREILAFLKNAGIRTGLASSTNKAVILTELGDAGLLSYFESITGGDAVRISKPNPEIYLLSCKDMGVDPADTIAIEDSYNGIRAARAAGMRPVMVPDLVPPDEEMQTLSEVILTDLFAVIDYLKT